jgi:hypothetical protein
MEATGTTSRPDLAPGEVDHVQIVREKYDACRQNLVATSRTRLAKHLTQACGIPHKQALEIVDDYCEAESVAIPTYLSKDFSVGWLKVVAVVNVVLAGVCLWYGRILHLQKIQPYGLWCIGACLCGLAVLSWVKSLEQEVANAKTDGPTGG